MPRMSAAGPMAMVLIGVLLILAAAGGAVTAALAGGAIGDKSAKQIPGEFSIADDGTGVLSGLRLAGGQRYAVASDPQAAESLAGGARYTIRVVAHTGQDSQPVPVAAQTDTSVVVSGHAYQVLATFNAPVDGSYTVAVTDQEATDGEARGGADDADASSAVRSGSDAGSAEPSGQDARQVDAAGWAAGTRSALVVTSYTSQGELAPAIVALCLGIIGAIIFGSAGIALILAGTVWSIQRRRAPRGANQESADEDVCPDDDETSALTELFPELGKAAEIEPEPETEAETDDGVPPQNR